MPKGIAGTKDPNAPTNQVIAAQTERRRGRPRKVQKELREKLIERREKAKALSAINLDFKLHQKQWEVYEALEEKNKQFVAALCGRRFGKTYLASKIALKYLLSTKKDIAYVTPKYEYGAKVLLDLKSQLEELKLLGSAAGKENMITCKTGSRMKMYSADANKDVGRGFSWDLVIIDEAALIKDIEFIFNASILPTLAERKGKVLMISTPKAVTNGFYKLYRQWSEKSTSDPLYAAFSGTSFENEYIDGSQWDILRGTMPESIFNMEIMAVPSLESGIVFQDSESVLVPDVLDKDPIAFGIDFGQKQDFTVVTAMNSSRQVFLCHRFQGENWEVVLNKVRGLIKMSVPIYCDATGVGAPLADRLTSENYLVVPIVWNQTNKNAMVNLLQLDIARKNIQILKSESKDLLEEMSIYEYAIGDSGKISYGAPVGCHDDCVSSLLMLDYGLHTQAMEGLGSIHSEDDFFVPLPQEVGIQHNDVRLLFT